MDPRRLDRLRRVAAESGLQPIEDPEPIVSYSNDTWMITDAHHGPVILRICYRGDVRRLTRETMITKALPLEVPTPAVLADGRVGDLTWAVTTRLSGCTLSAAWPTLDEGERHSAISQLATHLRGLHTWRPTRDTVAELMAEGVCCGEVSAGLDPPTDAETSAIVGAAMNPLPYGLDRLVDGLVTRRVPAGLIGATRRLFADGDRLGDDLDHPELTGLTHGDLHLENVWWDGDHVSVLDLEWARFAPPWTDLARFVDVAETDAVEGLPTHTEALVLLRRSYPELFDVPGLDDRLRRYRAAYQVRDVYTCPPFDEATSPADHPVRVLRSLVF